LDTKVGQKIFKLFGLKEGKPLETRIFDIKGERILARSIQGGNSITRTIARGMLRIPVIGIFVLTALELPAIIKAVRQGKSTEDHTKSGFKQIIKSLIFVSSILSGIGIFGALGAKKGPAGSLIGMGVGSIVGGFISKKANETINQL
jgi:hypothetical protein